MSQKIPSWPWPLPEQRLDCSCPKVKCERHGRCRECYGHHGRRGRLPRCLGKRADG